MAQNNPHSQSSDSFLTRWSKKLQSRWGVTGNRVLIILIVFACTGTTVLLLKKPVVNYFAGDSNPSVWFSVLYYVLILPIYNIILLLYGFIFGQFKFFWNFEKKMLERMTKRFKKK
ncbi:MAG: DUF6787 family protein [Putridiphycobacter sp.]|nr:DUF6787 family protein [Putridiphycobacter sp.]